MTSPGWLAAAAGVVVSAACNALWGVDELGYGRGVGYGAAPAGGAQSPGGSGGTSGGHSTGGDSTGGGPVGGGGAGGTGGQGGGSCVLSPFGLPVDLTELNSAADDLDAWVSGDGLALYFTSSRAGGPGSFDNWVAMRSSEASPFVDAIAVIGLNSAYDDRAPTGSLDGRMLVFSTDRPGGAGSQDLMTAARDDDSSPFGPPSFLAAVNSTGGDSDPTLTADLLLLCFSSDRPGGVGGRDVWCATRPDVSSAFGVPTDLTAVNTANTDSDPCLSGDGLTIFFSSNRPGGLGGADIWTATRVDRSSPFGEPVVVTELSSTAADWSAALSADGQTIFLASDRAGGAGMLDLWYATRTCEPR